MTDQLKRCVVECAIENEVGEELAKQIRNTDEGKRWRSKKGIIGFELDSWEFIFYPSSSYGEHCHDQ